MDNKDYDLWKLDTPSHYDEKEVEEQKNEIDYSTLEVDGIDTKDYPDFCDAYICGGEYTNGLDISDEHLDELNDDSQLVYNLVWNSLF